MIESSLSSNTWLPLKLPMWQHLDVEKLKRYRREAGLTQEELGAVLGVGKSVISRIESGQRPPTYVQLQKLADALRLEFYIGPPRRSGAPLPVRAAMDLLDVYLATARELARLHDEVLGLGRRYSLEVLDSIQSDADAAVGESERMLRTVLSDLEAAERSAAARRESAPMQMSVIESSAARSPEK